jgi:hypothetical protein
VPAQRLITSREIIARRTFEVPERRRQAVGAVLSGCAATYYDPYYYDSAYYDSYWYGYDAYYAYGWADPYWGVTFQTSPSDLNAAATKIAAGASSYYAPAGCATAAASARPSTTVSRAVTVRSG